MHACIGVCPRATRFRTDDQQCPSEFLECLLEICSPLRKHFEINVKKKWTCLKCDISSESDDIVTTLPLSDLDGNSSADLIWKNLRKNDIIFKQCYNPKCQNETDITWPMWLSLPTLTLYQLRFDDKSQPRQSVLM